MSPVTELVMTTDLALLRTMVGKAARQTFQTPLMLMPICASRHASSLVRKSLSVQMPALQSRMSIVPYVLRVKSTRFLQDWASLTLQRKPTASRQLPAAPRRTARRRCLDVASSGEHHARPLFGENASDTCPNALGSSCDNGNLPIKLTYADQLPLMQAMRRAMAPAPPYKMPTMVGRPCCRDADGGFRAHYRTVASGVQVIYKPFREKHAMVRTVCSKVERAYMEDMQ